jgi:hypothetical protein
VNILFKILKEKKMKKLMVMVAAIAMLTGSAYAADWDFYGSARIGTFYTSGETIGAITPDVNNYNQYLHTNARIGANVKVSDELTGRFEYGTSGGVANIRLLYGTWTFGEGKLVVGQDYSPLNFLWSNQVGVGDGDGDANGLKHGGVYSGSAGQLKLVFGGFEAALVPVAINTTVAAVSTETTIPGIEASYGMTFDNIALKLAGGFQTYDAKLAGGQEESVTSYVLAAYAKADFGAFYLAGNAYGGQNAGNMIAVDTDGDNSFASNNGIATLTGTQVIDSDVYGLLIAAGFVINDMFSVEAGYGYVSTELDVAGIAGNRDKLQTYYLNSTVNLAPGVFIVPEVGVMDGEENGDTKVTYGGIKWQINF